MRYTHWFWNSRLVNFVASVTTNFQSWLWHKQYGRSYQNDYWHST